MDVDKMGEGVNVGEILAAAKICTLSYPNGFTKGIRLFNKMRYWRYNDAKEGEKFQAYFMDYCHFPELWDAKTDGKGKSNNPAPDPLGTMCQIMRMGFSESEAWNMPIGKAYWYSTVQAQLDGADIDFITDKERKIEEELAAFNEKVEAGEFEGMNPLMSNG